MKVFKKIFPICLLIGLLTACFSQSNFSKQYSLTTVRTISVLDLTDDDCYTYERVFIDGLWWIFVYDCDGIFVKSYLDENY